ncbi:MAG: hypothetical protein MJY73_02215 [Bacteroidales bacterium]|nr:hypothetical protein [Bacteroidales bacterium]
MKNNIEPNANQKPHYFHCATKGLPNDLLFGSEKAFIAGMNRIAVCYLKMQRKSPVLIIAFCLMDNHLHFILHGTEEDCMSFMQLYKKLTEMWLAKHPEEGLPGKNWEIGIWLIPDQEHLIEKIVYVLRNPMAAGQPFTPITYRWSSGGLLFSDKSFVLNASHFAKEMTGNQQRLAFFTREQIPDNWLVMPDGIIWPGNYTQYQRAERAFRNVWQFMFELSQKVEEKVNLEIEEDYISLPDNEIREKAVALSMQMFNRDRISDLSVLQRQRLGKELKRQVRTSTKQIARIVHIRYEILKELLR